MHSFTQPIAFLILILSLLLLQGCQSKPQGYSVQDISEVESWFIRGQIYVIMPEERFQANIVWDKQDDLESIRLLSPLGTSLLTLEKTKNLSLLSIDDKTYYADDAEKLLYSMTGWHIPIERMSYWMRGLQHPQDQVISRDNDGFIRTLRTNADGEVWYIDIDKRQTLFDANIPERIVLKHKDTKIKVIIYEWIPQ